MTRAQAVPQAAGTQRPEGSVLFVCGGTNEHGAPCGKLLMVWVPGAGPQSGAAEIKCRRCKALNCCPLTDESR